MKSTLSTVSALVAALSLTSAAPMPSNHATSSEIGIVVQLAGFDAASVLDAVLDQTTVARIQQIKEAAVNEQGPWCAGFSDVDATRVVRAVDGGDGIFDSVNPAVYVQGQNSEETVTVASYWCAQTRKEVENFVARAGQNNNSNNKGAASSATATYTGSYATATPQATEAAPAPVNNGAGNGNAAEATVRVQIELERQTTFVQSELPANVGLVDASTVSQLTNEVVSISVLQSGSCDFFSDANGNTPAVFPGAVGSFECTA